MKLKCLHCGYEFDGTISYDELGWHSSCPECECSFDVDVPTEIYSADTIEYRNIDTNESYEERDIVFWFDVPKEWAEKWCNKNGYKSLEEFDKEYIWSDSWDMYCSAKEDNVVIDIREIENEIVYLHTK